MSTQEKNELIASFTGNPYVKGLGYEVNNIPSNETYISGENMKYNTDWNWLMAAIKYIFDGDDYYEHINIDQGHGPTKMHLSTSIVSVYNGLFRYCDWVTNNLVKNN